MCCLDHAVHFGDVYSFGEGKFWLVAGGLFCSAVTGCVFPAMVFIYATSFQEIGGSTSQADFLDGIRGVAFSMMVLGYVHNTLQSECHRGVVRMMF